MLINVLQRCGDAARRITEGRTILGFQWMTSVGWFCWGKQSIVIIVTIANTQRSKMLSFLMFK